MDEKEDKSRYLSIKWKAVIMFSLLLVAINGGLALLGYFQAKQQFAAQRHDLQQHQDRSLKSELEQSYLQMQSFASLVSMLGSNPENKRSFSNQLERVFTSYAPMLELDLGLVSAAFFDKGGVQQFVWQPHAMPDQVSAWVAEVNKTERPLSSVGCADFCQQFVFIPLLVDNRRVGVLMVVRQLSDLVLEFGSDSGDDLALIRPMKSGRAIASEREIAEWDLWVEALSHKSTLMPVIKHAAKRVMFDQTRGDGLQIRVNKKSYELRSVVLDSQFGASEIKLMVITDITSEMERIFEAAWLNFRAGFLGLILSGGFLLLFLWSPMRQLQVLTNNLPLLAKGGFLQVRQQLKPHSGWGPKDEIDLAQETSFKLSYQLEALLVEQEERNEILAKRGLQLTAERDFIAGLLDTAQVVILTLDIGGRLQMLNKYGERILGLRESEMVGTEFISLLEPDGVCADVSQALASLAFGHFEHYSHDSEVVTHAGICRHISWYHARLSDNPMRGDAIILSVGLDITEREDAEKRLIWLADHDPLTELHNRRRFESEFQQILRLSERYKHNGALLFLDLDHFKNINDTSGHQAGDALIRVAAENLKQVVRNTDLLARLGGDEFGIVLPESDLDVAIHIAEKIHDQLGDLLLPVEGYSHRVSVSIGITLFPQDGIDANELMANADLAMYQAKDRGRSCHHVFSINEKAREQLDSRVRWKEKIEQALVENRFVLQYQPIMSIKGQDISHFEVLVRMRELDGSLEYPGRFIPVAEQSGQIHAIDRYVLSSAIKQLGEFQKTSSDIHFSVNFSGKMFSDPDYLPMLKKLLLAHEVDPSHLIFEITETAALSDIASAARLMGEIKALGCKMALDDFGVGFSSFFYLKNLPVDYVKIDGSFIRQLPTSSEDRLFVRALVEVAKGLGKQTIAEFVENDATLYLLEEIGVDYAQGFYVGKPKDEISAVPRFLLDEKPEVGV
ncbi:MAG: EAL domain-containing protein [Gammaproteobacteria bacterium]|nr:EAL domain-containing protein [Gammaproteobacteria bacterium]